MWRRFFLDRPWRLALIWLVVLSACFFSIYGFANHYTATLDNVGVYLYSWETRVAFVPWTIVPYWSIDLFFGLVLFVCTRPRELNILALRMLLCILICVSGFLLFPLQFGFERPQSDGFFGFAFATLYEFDLPYNQAPSLHIALLIVIALKFWQYSPRFWRIPLLVWALLVTISVLTTHQHHFLDIWTGAIVGVMVCYMLPEGVTWKFEHLADPKGRTIAIRYLLLSTLCLALSWILGGWFWLCSWLGFSALLMTFAYLGFGTNILQKVEGKLSFASWWIFLPLRLLMRLVRFFYLKNIPMYSEVTPSLYLASYPRKPLPLSQMFVLDLCAEYPRSNKVASSSYASVPMLDLVQPSFEQMNRAVDTLLKDNNPKLIHCALGLGRTALVAAGYLLVTKQANDVNGAKRILQQARSHLVLREAQIEYLTKWWAQYEPDNQ